MAANAGVYINETRPMRLKKCNCKLSRLGLTLQGILYKLWIDQKPHLRELYQKY